MSWFAHELLKRDDALCSLYLAMYCTHLHHERYVCMVHVLADMLSAELSAEFLRQLQLWDKLGDVKALRDFLRAPLRLRDGSVARLPVHDSLYKELIATDNTFSTCLQPVSQCGAGRLATVLSYPLLHPSGDAIYDEISVARKFCNVLCDAYRPIMYVCSRKPAIMLSYGGI